MTRVNTAAGLKLQSPVTACVVDYGAYQTDIHQLRQAVFVHEQQVPAWFETDPLDPLCRHVLAYWNGWVVGTGRLTPEGRIGRVAVAKPLRRRGVGRQMMAELLEEAKRQGQQYVVLAAQCHAIPFYEKLGFYCEGVPYEHVGIKHVTMRKSVA
ncbi:MAG: GNAT family N-acetyltransferase [Cyanobacteria bacterium]|nr:GNAT family N-acetyltransferase [Cyanobacteriota bacterium]